MKRLLTFLVALTLVMCLSVCSVAVSAADSLPVIKVASVTPLSGSQAAMGEVIKKRYRACLSGTRGGVQRPGF